MAPWVWRGGPGAKEEELRPEGQELGSPAAPAGACPPSAGEEEVPAVEGVEVL